MLRDEREATQIGHQDGDLTLFAPQFEGIGFGEQVGNDFIRQIAPERFAYEVCPFLFRYGLPGLVDGNFQIVQVDRLHQEIKRPAVHGHTNIIEIPVSRNHDGLQFALKFRNFAQQGQAIHAGHVDIGEHDLNISILLEVMQCFNAIAGHFKYIGPFTNLFSELLPDQYGQVGFIVNYEYFGWHRHAQWIRA